ncbi:MAG: phosphatase PAP2 family protein [Actinomycetota bacterium]|nr:phosphatase PAP2 family protein [Actinomycetota bacterium]HZY65735.1 phosphatase PAP2 family protein [Rubrobacteraceae bacterium]
MKSFVWTVRNLDRGLFRAIFGLKCTPLTVIMRWFTVAGTAGALWGFIAAGMFVATGFQVRNLLLSWAAIALSWILAEGTKHLFDRSRPFIYDTSIAPLIKTPSSSSFPSGHSATAAAGALALSVFYPLLAPVLVPAAILVILSRVYLGVHYPFDVLAGGTIGLATAAVLLLIW